MATLMAKRNYYTVLGIERDADEKTLRDAFRSKAKQYHPDRNAGDAEAEARFKEVNEAYEALKNPQMRAAYDQYGHAAFENGGRGRGGGFDGASVSDIFEDLFGDLMGGGRRGRRQRRGADRSFEIVIDLEDAFHGKNIQIDASVQAPCPKCNGDGAEPGTQPQTCSDCRGSGKVRLQQGFFTVQHSCPSCGGRGRRIGAPCKACDGGGLARTQRALSVAVPKGIESGNRIRLSGKGDAGAHGAPPGDLYLTVRIRDHEVFERCDDDILCRAHIPFAVAALGGTLQTPDIEGGRVDIKIPEGAQHGQRFRLRGKGMPHLRSAARGDMYVEIGIETPIRLSSRQKSLLREFQEASSERNTPTTSGFFAKIKKFWDRLQD